MESKSNESNKPNKIGRLEHTNIKLRFGGRTCIYTHMYREKEEKQKQAEKRNSFDSGFGSEKFDEGT